MASKLTRSDALENSGRNFPASPFRLFEDFFNDWAFRSMDSRKPETWTPAADILERDGNLIFMVSLPGLAEKDFELKVEGLSLTIRGERKPHENDGYTCHQQESRYGSFSRTFTLSDRVAIDNVKADFKNGILVVTIPQKPELKPRTIKVNV